MNAYGDIMEQFVVFDLCIVCIGSSARFVVILLMLLKLFFL